MIDVCVIGQRLKVHSSIADGDIFDRYAAVRGYTDEDEILVRFDDQGYACRLPADWLFDLILGEPVSHWQVWEVSRGARLVKDSFETPLRAKYFSKEQDGESHRVAARHDNWVPPPQVEVRIVPMEGDRHAYH